jgi:hypothetical protein
LVEFKPVFEFICLISCEKKNCKPFPSPPLTYLAFGPARLTQRCGPARLIQPRGPASIRQPNGGPVADPRLLLLVPLAGGPQWSSLTSGARAEPHPGSALASRPRPAPFLGPARPGCPLGLFSRRRSASLGFCPHPQQPSAAATSNPSRAARRRSEPPPPHLSRFLLRAWQGGEQDSGVVCARPRVLNRRRELTGVAAAPPAAPSRCTSSSSPVRPVGPLVWVCRVELHV